MNGPLVRQRRGLEPSSSNPFRRLGLFDTTTAALPYSTASSSWSSSFSVADTGPAGTHRFSSFRVVDPARIAPITMSDLCDDYFPQPARGSHPFPPTGGSQSDGAHTGAGPTMNPDNYQTPRCYGGNSPFDDADGTGSSLSTDDDVPSPWDDDDDGHVIVQPVSSGAPAFDGDGRLHPQLCPCPPYDVHDGYDDDIEAMLRAQENEPKTRPSPNYLDTTQGGRLTQDARATLVIWMKELAQRYDLLAAAGTLHRAVSYADRFLSVEPLEDVAENATRWLRLLGAAAVFAAAKYEDQGAAHKLDAAEIARYGGNGDGGGGGGGFVASWSKREVLGMERALLVALDHRMGRPTAHTFVDHFFTARRRRYDGQGQEQEEEVVGLMELLRSRAHDVAEISLLQYSCLEHKPSAVAAAAMFLARLSLKPSCGEMRRWNRELKEVTGYEPLKLERCVEAIHSLIPQHGNGSYDDVDLFPMFYAIADPE